MVKNIMDREQLQEYLNSKNTCIRIINIGAFENKVKIDNQVHSKGWYMRIEYYDGSHELYMDDYAPLKKKEIEIPVNTEKEKIYEIIKAKASSIA